MKKIAITGGIASGKSTVSKIIESLGGYVIFTDKINSQMLEDKDYISKIAQLFPGSVKNGVVDRGFIRQQILCDEDKRLSLNSLAHTEIKRRVDFLVDKFNGKAIFCEIPLIVESNMVDYFDQIWCVVADLDTRIDRVMARDGVSRQDANSIIAVQQKDEELIAISDIVIKNDGNYAKLEEKVKEIYKSCDL